MLIPSIDLRSGQVVQLRHGRDQLLALDDWHALVQKWRVYGDLAVVDLDGALGSGNNRPIVFEILQECQARVGGGIRTVRQVEELLRAGARKVILSSALFRGGKIHRSFIRDLLNRIPPERILFSLDVWEEEVMIKGWRASSGLRLPEALDALKDYRTGFLITFIEREGTQQGLPLDRIRQLRQTVSNELVVAGGTQSEEEVVECDRLGVDVQVGLSLYQGKIDPARTFLKIMNWKDSLLPSIVQDEDGQVLMLAYVNQESLAESFRSGRVCFYSRSRRRLWRKGETSGNFLELVNVSPDCDRDSLLCVVRPAGPACHRLSYSCFGSGEEEFTLSRLERVLRNRLTEKPPSSYSASLTGEERRKKLLEECLEFILAKNRDESVWEAADVVYFLTLLMAEKGIRYRHVLAELARRKR